MATASGVGRQVNTEETAGQRFSSVPNSRVLILSAESWKFLTGQSVLAEGRGGQAFANAVSNRINVADSWSEGRAFPWIVFTLVEISVNGLVLLQAFKALRFLGFSGGLVQYLPGG